MNGLYEFLDKNSYYLVLIIAMIIWVGLFGYNWFVRREVNKLKKG